jgi:hypothetical protein
LPAFQKNRSRNFLFFQEPHTTIKTQKVGRRFLFQPEPANKIEYSFRAELILFSFNGPRMALNRAAWYQYTKQGPRVNQGAIAAAYSAFIVVGNMANKQKQNRRASVRLHQRRSAGNPAWLEISASCRRRGAGLHICMRAGALAGAEGRTQARMR